MNDVYTYTHAGFLCAELRYTYCKMNEQMEGENAGDEDMYIGDGRRGVASVFTRRYINI